MPASNGQVFVPMLLIPQAEASYSANHFYSDNHCGENDTGQGGQRAGRPPLGTVLGVLLILQLAVSVSAFPQQRTP